MRIKSQLYPGLDMLKLVAAILVVILHAIELDTVIGSGIKWTITRLAVPFFLITSGFFFQKGLSNSTDKKTYFLQYEKRLLLLYLIWAVLITGFGTIRSYYLNNAQHGIVYVILVILRRMVLIGHTQYWYLITLIFSTAFLYLCAVVHRENLIAAGAILGFVLLIAYSCFRGILGQIGILEAIFRVIDLVFSWEFNFITFGIPFCAVGYFFASKNVRFSMDKAIAVFCAATVLRFLEYIIPVITPGLNFWNENSISVMYIIQAVAFFFIGVNWDVRLRDSLSVRQLSTFIYCAHASVLYSFLDPLFGTLFPNGLSHTAVFVCIKVLLTVSICAALFWIIKKINNRYLNTLING